MPTERPRVALETLGCRLNQAESEALARRLAGAGYLVVSPREGADIRVVNTCTVTAEADRQSRQETRRARRACSFLAVVGCSAQRSPGSFPQADLVLGNAGKDALVDALRRARPPSSSAGPPPALRARATAKAQEGCNLACTYCVVPQVRGRERCLPPEAVLAEIRARVAEGCQEVVLTGTRLGAYDRPSLPGLVARILAETALPRLRLSSLLPQDLTPDLLGLWRDPRLCRHLHLPLQSGSEPVLRAMKRPYTVASYRRAAFRVLEAVPGLALTTDVIAGFPGEGEAEFCQTQALGRELSFARLHVFPYSPRPGTPAAGFPGQVPSAAKKERVRELMALSQELARRFRESFLGQSLPVVWEQREGVALVGHTDNYIKVRSGDAATRVAALLPDGTALLD